MSKEENTTTPADIGTNYIFGMLGSITVILCTMAALSSTITPEEISTTNAYASYLIISLLAGVVPLLLAFFYHTQFLSTKKHP